MIRIMESGLTSAIAALEQINFNGLRQRLTGAVRRTLQDARSFGRGKVTQRYAARNAGNIGSQSLKAAGLNGILTIGGRRNQLKKFIINPRSRPKKMPAGGVYAQVVRGQGGQIRRAFLQRSGGVFERTGASRYPIRQLKTIAAPGMWKAVSEPVVARMSRRLGLELDAALGGV